MRDMSDTHVHRLSWERRADDIVAQVDEFGIRTECVVAPPTRYENREALKTVGAGMVMDIAPGAPLSRREAALEKALG